MQSATGTSEDRKAAYKRKLAERVQRERERAEKRAQKEAEKAARAQFREDARLRRSEELARREAVKLERFREAERRAEAAARDANDLADYRAGRKTPGAARAKHIVEEVAAKRRAAARPKFRGKGKRKKPGPEDFQEESILDPDGSGRITVLHRGFSLRGYQEHLVRAAERFAHDWEVAYSGGVKAASFVPKVDGTAAGVGPHVTRIDAQKRMQALQAYLQEELWLLMLATVIHGYSPLRMQQRGMGSASTFAVKVKHALDVTAAFYGSKERRRNRAIVDLTRLIEEGQRASL